MELGEITKLKFTACSDVKCEEELKPEKSYSVMINPESFKRSMNLVYDEKQAKGSSSSPGQSDKQKPEAYSFDFIVDGTGLVAEKEESVSENIERFLAAVYNYVSDSHRPPYVRIEYCGLLMKCVLKSLDINYTLFDPDSTPLRAKISCSFDAVESPEMDAKKKDKQSPDITHKRIMQEGDTLIVMSNYVYNSDLYYMDVAEKNNLNNFRRIKQGTAIYFPPLKK